MNFYLIYSTLLSIVVRLKSHPEVCVYLHCGMPLVALVSYHSPKLNVGAFDYTKAVHRWFESQLVPQGLDEIRTMYEPAEC